MKRDICHFVTKIMSVTCPSHFELVRNDRLIRKKVDLENADFNASVSLINIYNNYYY